MECFHRQSVKYSDAAQHASGHGRDALQAIAERVAGLLGYEPGRSLRRLLQQLGGRVTYLDPMQLAHCDGSVYVHGERDFDVLVPDWTSCAEDNFTIAHELAHYVLHSRAGGIPMIATRDRGPGTRSEWEADCFARAFLMPAARVEDEMARTARDQALVALRMNVTERDLEDRVRELERTDG
jgi:Zn-dependent peptidase ImmA (M78 family)